MEASCVAVRAQVLEEVTATLDAACHVPQLLSLVVEYAVDMDLLRLTARLEDGFWSSSNALLPILRGWACTNCRNTLSKGTETVWSGSPIGMDTFLICNACYLGLYGVQLHVQASCCDALIDMRTGWKRDPTGDANYCHYHALGVDSKQKTVYASVKSLQGVNVQSRVITSRIFTTTMLMPIQIVPLSIPSMLSSSTIYASRWFSTEPNRSELRWINGRDILWGYSPRFVMITFQNLYKWLPFDDDQVELASVFALVNCNERSPMYKRVAVAVVCGYGRYGLDMTDLNIDAYMKEKQAFNNSADPRKNSFIEAYRLKHYPPLFV